MLPWISGVEARLCDSNDVSVDGDHWLLGHSQSSHFDIPCANTPRPGVPQHTAAMYYYNPFRLWKPLVGMKDSCASILVIRAVDKGAPQSPCRMPRKALTKMIFVSLVAG